MKRALDRISRVLAGIWAGCIFFGMAVLAESQAAILETFTGEKEISVYVAGAESNTGNINVQIATGEAGKVSIHPISEADVPMKTLVMVDNSLSISKDNRGRITEFLQNLVADRMNREEICIAVFDEEVRKLTDYTSDYGTLKQAVEDISYQDQETYLTDVLYDLVSAEYAGNREDVYHRIIVVSDGVDNKSVGYTKEELYSLLKEVPIPVYTVGCRNGKNNEQLESLFAISRMTSADYFLLDETENLLDITEELKKDREVVKLSVIPLDEMMDGGRKTVKISFPDGMVLTVEMVMPQQTYVREPEEELSVEITEGVEEEVGRIGATADGVIPEETQESRMPVWLMVVIAVSAVAVMAGAGIAGWLIRRKRKREQEEFEPYRPASNPLRRDSDGTEGRTVLLSPSDGQGEDGGTVMIWNQRDSWQLVLTDIHSPAKSFQVPLNKSVIVGRERGSCDIALDYAPSVSRRHCEISVRDGKYYVKDLQSSNGTYLNGDKVLTESEIYSGNILTLGSLKLKFDVR